MRWTDTMMDDHIYLSDWGIYRLANHLTDALGQPMTITSRCPSLCPQSGLYVQRNMEAGKP
jgi:hypothetical protein